MDDKLLEAFSFGCIQDCANIKSKLDKNGVSWDEFLEWLDSKRQPESKPAEKQRIPGGLTKYNPERECPECGNWLRIKPVNNSPATKIEDEPELKCVWMCPYCKFEEFSAKSINEEIQPYMVDITKTTQRRRKQSRIIHPNKHKMLYYGNPRRRLR